MLKLAVVVLFGGLFLSGMCGDCGGLGVAGSSEEALHPTPATPPPGVILPTPTPSFQPPTPGPTPAPVVYASISWDFPAGSSPCLGTTIDLAITNIRTLTPAGSVPVVDAAKPGDAVEIQFSGPGLPPSLTSSVGSDGSVTAGYAVMGSGQWTVKLVSVGGNRNVAAGAVTSTATCQ